MLSRKYWVTGLVLAAILHTAVSSPGIGTDRENKNAGVRKTSVDGSSVPFLINHVLNYYGNNGDGSYNRFSGDNEGFEFPKGSGKHAVFEDGIVWGGFQHGYPDPKVGGSVYRHALQPGKILSPGTPLNPPIAVDPGLMKYRVYRVRPDVGPAVPFDAAMDTKLETSEVEYVNWFTPTTARQIYDQYLRDWAEWPAADGAPFYDVNRDGRYDPSIDVPGVPGADQTLWYVANDLDSSKTAQLAGCPPIGLEMQRTIWGYRTEGPLGNSIFCATKIINKSGLPVDSMFIVQWSDPDLGDAGDDYVGCDTVRMLGYAYNADSIDGIYGRTVPAVGFRLLEGPIAPGSPLDTATFGFARRPGYKNLVMTTFNFFSGGIPGYQDPRQGTGGNLEWYNLMNGLTIHGEHYVDPTTNHPSKFCFSGDPTVVPPSGWVEANLTPRGSDVRLVLVTGPISMADGDTQEVVVANLAGVAWDRLSSITALKASSDEIASAFRHLPPFPSPVLDLSILYPNSSQADVVIRADGRGSKATAISCVLRLRDGSTIGEAQLFDDGSHGDVGSHDGIFGNSVLIARQPAPLHIGATVTDQHGVTYTWEDLASPVTTASPLVLGEPVIFSDNINSDGRANPGESIRYGLSFSNPGPFPLSGITVDAVGSTHFFPVVLPGGTDSMRYRSAEPASYLNLWIPDGTAVGPYPVRVSITDTAGNLWNERLVFEVFPLPFTPVRDTAHHVRGKADGIMGILVVDPAQFRGHLYTVTGVDSISPALDHGIILKDSTDGRVLLQNWVIPDPLGHNLPVTDGFKIVGSFLAPGRAISYSFPTGGWEWTSLGATNVLGLEGMNGVVGNAFDHWPSGGLDYNHQHSVMITFAGTDTSGNLTNPQDPNASFAYRYLAHADIPAARPEFGPFIKNAAPGFAYQDYTRTLPFAAYDVDVTPAERRMVGYLENNVLAGLVDGKYWPPSSSSGLDNGIDAGPREWLFIFGSPYSTTPNPELQKDIANVRLPLMWIGYPSRRGSIAFHSGGQFEILAGHAPSSDDLWIFTLDHDRFLPADYVAFQNFPNPFNAGTVIRYTLPQPSEVTVKIFNILGQEVRTLEKSSHYAGVVDLQWDGTSNVGLHLASGVYIYRVETRSLVGAESTATLTRKMVLIK